MPVRRAHFFLLALLLVVSPLNLFWGGGRVAAGSGLQAEFSAAAAEFGVPVSVLLAVSYDESRWEQHAGSPSVAGGYGVMHLTDVPDGAAPGPVASAAARHTLLRAAELLKVSPDAMKQDPVQNVRGGAALLARFAQRTTGVLPTDPGEWYGAIAAYSGAMQADVARGFADAVMTTIRRGATRTTPEGETVVLRPTAVAPDRHTADSLYPPGVEKVPAECPAPLLCGSTLAGPANFLAADRPEDDLDIRYIVIHDTEETADDSLQIFQDAKEGTSAHYLVRASDGLVVQVVPTKDVAFHAGNWYVNSHSIGVEHEGYAVQGATWYDEPLYRASANLVRYLAAKYGVPLDRAHIIGHDNVPGQTPERQGTMHWDPGPYWDWAHYMELLGASITPGDNPNIITVAPPFADNVQQVDPDCEPPKVLCPDLPLEPTNFVRLHIAPSFDAPLLAEPALARYQAIPGYGTTDIQDWGDTAVTGEEFYLAGSSGDWDAIWFNARKAWFYNPGHANTAPGRGVAVTPRPDRGNVCVYGEAYPDPSESTPAVRVPAMVPLSCGITPGQVYIAADQVRADDFDPRAVVLGSRQFDQIFYNHRLAFVRAEDMERAP